MKTGSGEFWRGARGQRAAVGVALSLVLVGGGSWLARTSMPLARRVAYNPEGYGGRDTKVEPEAKVEPGKAQSSADPLQPALDAYNAGQYRQAEEAAERLVAEGRSTRDPARRKRAVRARWVTAFSAARRKELRLARERFAQLRQEASVLPDRGEQEAELGEDLPTLEEEGAYQHAVLTAALGERSAAEAEYLRFMRQYPESPLVHAAVKRIARMHGGDVPKEATEVWQAATALARQRELERGRAQALCGPETLSAVLERCAPEKAATVEELTRELGTDERGTTLLALAKAARRRGLEAKGLRLSWKGLRETAAGKKGERKTQLVALIRPEHFVVVEDVTAIGVTVWDPQAGGVGKPGTRSYGKREWEQAWTGVVLSVQ